MDKCPDSNLALAFIEGSLAVKQRSGIERHMDSCADCRELMADMVRESGVVEVESGTGFEATALPTGVGSGESADDQAPLPAGTRVDSFEIEKVLGRGGMGLVYRARDLQLGRKVALKMVRQRLAKSHEARARFRREAMTTAKFTHPNIVTVLATGEHEGTPYVALEYLEGKTLAAHLNGKAIEVGEAMHLGSSISSALREAHRHGVLHRDLKPENVHIDELGHVRVLDFGLAKLLEQGEAPASVRAAEFHESASVFETRASVAMGTPAYMAPEQWAGEACDGAADVWALGMILFEMLAGRLPYKETKLAMLAVRVCDQHPVPDVRDQVEVSAELAALVAACLEKFPEDRPSAQQAGDSLDAILEAVVTHSTPLVDPAVLSRRASASERAAPQGRRLIWPLVGAAGIGIGLWGWLQAGGTDERSPASANSVPTASATAVPTAPAAAAALPTVASAVPPVSSATASASAPPPVLARPRARVRLPVATPTVAPTAAPTASSKGGLFKGRF